MVVKFQKFHFPTFQEMTKINGRLAGASTNGVGRQETVRKSRRKLVLRERVPSAVSWSISEL
jgi:hypothetical protein